METSVTDKAQAVHPAIQQPAQRLDLRTEMPQTALWVDRQRQELGAAHVNACLRRALKGEPGWFWAIEHGRVLGTPFPASAPIANEQRVAVLTGATFAGFIALPEVVTP